MAYQYRARGIRQNQPLQLVVQWHTVAHLGGVDTQLENLTEKFSDVSVIYFSDLIDSEVPVKPLAIIYLLKLELSSSLTCAPLFVCQRRREYSGILVMTTISCNK